MPELRGTRVYWRPSASATTAPTQILKNSGYVSVTLQAVQYKARGDWWQRTFGGSDKITVSTQVTWQNGTDNKTAAAVQDFRKIRVPSLNALAIGRNIALKVPASADGIELTISIHAVHDDNLGKTLQLLNSDEFKKPLQLAPVAVGEILSITNLVKKTFTDVEDDALTATYPGIVSADEVPDPIAVSRLVEGYIIVVVRQDDEDELDYDPSRLSVSGNRVLLDGEALPNTYMVYNVSFDRWRGADPASGWAKKFAEASSKADELIFAEPDQRQSIIASARDLLMQGKGLIDADETYRSEEKALLAAAAFKAVTDKIKANSTPGPASPVSPRGVRRPVGRFEWEPEPHDGLGDYVAELSRAGLAFGFSLDVGSEN